MVGIAKDKGSKPQPLLDAEGNPIQPVCDANGQMVAPRMEDEHGNVIHEGPKGSGMKTAAILGGAALPQRPPQEQPFCASARPIACLGRARSDMLLQRSAH